MEPTVHIFGVAKRGNSSEEYEDAVASSSEGRRFAIADGATQTSYADRWSQILALEFVMNPPAEESRPQRWKQWLEPLQEAWSLGVPWEKLPWFAVEKARAGASTTLLALEFIPNDDVPPNQASHTSFWRRMLGPVNRPLLRWRAEAVGDTCLFVVREDQLVHSFPLDRSEDFNHSPLLITTDRHHNQQAIERMRVTAGDCFFGDVFLLMTDALAKWFLQHAMEETRPWSRLRQLKHNDEFKEFVEIERRGGRMENDDTTLLRIQWPEPEEVAS